MVEEHQVHSLMVTGNQRDGVDKRVWLIVTVDGSAGHDGEAIAGSAIVPPGSWQQVVVIVPVHVVLSLRKAVPQYFEELNGIADPKKLKCRRMDYHPC